MVSGEIVSVLIPSYSTTYTIVTVDYLKREEAARTLREAQPA